MIAQAAIDAMREPEARHKTLGRAVRELLVYKALLRKRPHQPSVVFLPSQGREDGAANLRAYAIADELRARGWNAEVLPKHLNLAQRRRIIAVLKPDLLVMQTARHPLNRPQHYPGVPVVFDIDDADYIADHSRPAVVEAVSGAAAVIAGSRSVAAFCRTLNDRVTIIWTGTPMGPTPPPQTARPPVVTWAVSNPASYPAEADFVIAVLQQLHALGANFSFRLYGDDGSQPHGEIARRIRSTGIACETVGYLGYDAFLASLCDVSVGLAPLVNISGFSGGKSFGKVLAYFNSGVPIITHPVVDHPLVFEHGRNGFLAEQADDWAEKAALLLADADLREALSVAGRATLASRLSVRTSAELTDRYLRQLLAR